MAFFCTLGVNKSLVVKLVEMMGPDFEKLKGKGTEKKNFYTWLTKNI